MPPKPSKPKSSHPSKKSHKKRKEYVIQPGSSNHPQRPLQVAGADIDDGDDGDDENDGKTSSNDSNSDNKNASSSSSDSSAQGTGKKRKAGPMGTATASSDTTSLSDEEGGESENSSSSEGAKKAPSLAKKSRFTPSLITQRLPQVISSEQGTSSAIASSTKSKPNAAPMATTATRDYTSTLSSSSDGKGRPTRHPTQQQNQNISSSNSEGGNSTSTEKAQKPHSLTKKSLEPYQIMKQQPLGAISNCEQGTSSANANSEEVSSQSAHSDLTSPSS